MSEVTNYTLRRSAGVFGDCRAVREKIQAIAPIPDDQIITFPWGTDLKLFSPHSSALPLRQDLGWVGKTILISTRTWEPLYAIDVLVRAIAAVREHHPEVRLVLLGDGSQGPKIRSLISQLELTDYIHAPGRVSYELLPEYFTLADVYVSSALSDGSSISLLEAMACGLPVVVTNGYGNREWVKPGQNGWLATPGDPASLAAALHEALGDPSRLAEMKSANVSLASARADWNKNFPQLLTFFQRLVKPSSVSKDPLASNLMESETL
jgi:glycosyltransferase involved in cell wall biosynthesis